MELNKRRIEQEVTDNIIAEEQRGKIFVGAACVNQTQNCKKKFSQSARKHDE